MNYTRYLHPSDIILSKKSFIAYIKPLSIWLIIWIIASSISIILSLLLLIIGVLIFLQINSVVIYINSKGIWVFSGITPWNRGSYGIKLDEFGMAEFIQTPMSWLTKSYTIRLKYKYNDKIAFILKDVEDGDKVVTRINQL